MEEGSRDSLVCALRASRHVPQRRRAEGLAQQLLLLPAQRALAERDHRGVPEVLERARATGRRVQRPEQAQQPPKAAGCCGGPCTEERGVEQRVRRSSTIGNGATWQHSGLRSSRFRSGDGVSHAVCTGCRVGTAIRRGPCKDIPISHVCLNYAPRKFRCVSTADRCPHGLPAMGLSQRAAVSLSMQCGILCNHSTCGVS